MKECPVCHKQFGLFGVWFGGFTKHLAACVKSTVTEANGERWVHDAPSLPTTPSNWVPRATLNSQAPVRTQSVVAYKSQGSRWDHDRQLAPVDNDSSFLTSMIVADVTDSPMLGMLAGGSLSGSLIGAAMHEEAAPVYEAPVYQREPDPEPSYSGSDDSDDSSDDSSDD